MKHYYTPTECESASWADFIISFFCFWFKNIHILYIYIRKLNSKAMEKFSQMKPFSYAHWVHITRASYGGYIQDRTYHNSIAQKTMICQNLKLHYFWQSHHFAFIFLVENLICTCDRMTSSTITVENCVVLIYFNRNENASLSCYHATNQAIFNI